MVAPARRRVPLTALAARALHARPRDDRGGAALAPRRPRGRALLGPHGPAPAPDDGRGATPAARQPVRARPLGLVGPRPARARDDAAARRAASGRAVGAHVLPGGGGPPRGHRVGLAPAVHVRRRGRARAGARRRARNILLDGDPLLVADRPAGTAASPETPSRLSDPVPRARDRAEHGARHAARRAGARVLPVLREIGRAHV